jgi:hypothetical protein
MSHNFHSNRNNRNALNLVESDAFNRLAAILERNAAPPIVAAPRTCSMKQFTSCNPPKYSGEEGATALLQWFEAMETTFLVSECPEHLKVLYATTALTKKALTFWNGQKIILGLEEIAMLSWLECKSMLLDEFCPDNELAKLEEEFNGLKQIGGDNNTYTSRFHELSLLVPHHVTPEFRAIKKYVRGLPIEVQNLVTATQPGTLSSAIRMAATITDNYVSVGILSVLKKAKKEAITEPEPEKHQHKKAKFTPNYAITTPTPKANPTYSYSTQQPSKQSQSQTTTSAPLRRAYTGPHPLCSNCNFHHPIDASCRLCTRCNRLGHHDTHCRINPLLISNPAQPPRIANAPQPFLIGNAQPVQGCYNCGDPGHFKRACPKLQIAPVPQPARNRTFALTTAPTAPIPQQDQNNLPFVQRPGKAPEGTSVPRSDQAPDFYDYVMNS